MKKLTGVLAVGMCAALLGVVFAGNANGQDVGEKTFFTVTEPLDVGGTILQPGTYQIQVAPMRWNRDLLQVRTSDASKLIASLLTVPHPEGPAGVKVEWSRYVYYPAGPGHMKALKTWYAADTPSSGGHDLVYPKKRAMELAVLGKEPVVAISDDVKVADYETAPLVVVTPEKETKEYLFKEVTAAKPPVPEVAPAPPAKVAAVAPAPPAKVAEVVPAPPAKVAEPAVPQRRLPRTASNVPLHAGLGFLSLLGALGLGVLARRVA